MQPIKKKTPYLDFYEQCSKTGFIPLRGNGKTTGGLCSIFPKASLFQPTWQDELFHSSRIGFWGVEDIGKEANIWERATIFTPLRQNIVLFLAAMNNEL